MIPKVNSGLVWLTSLSIFFREVGLPLSFSVGLTNFAVTETSPFVDRLLATLRSKSFLPYLTTSEPPSQNHGPSQPRQSRSRKRGLEQDEQDKAHERDARGPPKGPRLQLERQTRRQPPDGPRSRSQRRDGRDDTPSQESSHQGRRDMWPDASPAPPTGPRASLQKERCRDYYGAWIKIYQYLYSM